MTHPPRFPRLHGESRPVKEHGIDNNRHLAVLPYFLPCSRSHIPTYRPRLYFGHPTNRTHILATLPLCLPHPLHLSQHLSQQMVSLGYTLFGLAVRDSSSAAMGLVFVAWVF